MGRENVRRRRAERDSASGGKLGHAIKIALPAKEAAFPQWLPWFAKSDLLENK